MYSTVYMGTYRISLMEMFDSQKGCRHHGFTNTFHFLWCPSSVWRWILFFCHFSRKESQYFAFPFLRSQDNPFRQRSSCSQRKTYYYERNPQIAIGVPHPPRLSVVSSLYLYSRCPCDNTGCRQSWMEIYLLGGFL